MRQNPKNATVRIGEEMAEEAFMDRPLSPEVCSQIYYAAIRNASRIRLEPVNAPEDVCLDQIIQQSKFKGTEIYLPHPYEVEEIFRAVDLGTYQFIEDMFCSRIGRSISMVFCLVNKKREFEQKHPIAETANWAICMYLDKKRLDIQDVTIEREGGNWSIVLLDLDISVGGKDKHSYHPRVVCVGDEKHVMAYRSGQPENNDAQVILAFYQAVVIKRMPSRDGTAGLIWNLPHEISSAFDIPDRLKNYLRSMGIYSDIKQRTPEFANHLTGDWVKDLSKRQIPEDRFSLILDNYFERFHGFGPALAEKELSFLYSHSRGYNRDPLWQFPALRQLFDFESAEVDANGIINIEHVQYVDSLLGLWKNQSVKVIVSPSDKTWVWVYDESGDVICQASAL